MSSHTGNPRVFRCPGYSGIPVASTAPRYMQSIPLQNAVKPMVLAAVQYTATQGDAKSVLDAIDTFSTHYRRLMTIGQSKGGKMQVVLQKHKPKVMYELGCFVGYGAVKFGAQLREWGGKFYSFEIDEQSVEVSRKIVEFAGLQDTVEIIHGGFDSSIGPFLASHPEHNGSVDAIFIDHWKDRYLPDIQLIESLKLLHTGSVVLADNILRPGAPDYLAYMKSQSDRYTSQLLEHTEPGSDVVVDVVLVNVVKE